MNREIKVATEEQIETGMIKISDQDLPLIISNQVKKLNELDVSVHKAMVAAEKAKESADSARKKSAGILKKKEAIEELQSATIDIAEAVQYEAETQKLSFEYHTKVAEITKFLFGLGVSNIASNRYVIRELELRLKNASEEELTDLARHEILVVVKQLKDQEDILQKQVELAQQLISHENQFASQNKVNLDVNEQLKVRAEADFKLERALDEQIELNRLHKDMLLKQEATIKESGEQILILKSEINETSQIVSEQRSVIDGMLSEITELKNDLQTKATKTLFYITLGIAAIALITSVIAIIV